MTNLRITKRTVDALKKCDGREFTAWDDTVSGFGVRVSIGIGMGPLIGIQKGPL